MPVQINEVIIKAIVDLRPTPGVDKGAQSPTDRNCCGAESGIVESVLEIIREKQQR